MKTYPWNAVLLIGSFVSASLFASAFYLVLVRGTISEDAQRIARLEYAVLKAQDELRALEVNVDDAVQPHVLQSRIGHALGFPKEGQVIRVRAAVLKHSEPTAWAPLAQEPFRKEGV